MRVNTVLGEADLSPAAGVLPHEHLVIDYRQKDGGSPPLPRAAEDTCANVLAGLPPLGVQAIVDCTPPGYGRDLDFLRRVSERSGVHIIASTGTFCEQWSGQPRWAEKAGAEELADSFIAELHRGCGVIKVATSHGAATENELKAISAAARAHQETGAPIVSHTTGSLGIEQADLYRELNVDLSKVLISHVCADNEPPDYAMDIARRGAYVGFDRIGHSSHTDEHWIQLIQALLTEGLGDRILLSHDSVQQFTGPDAIAGHTFSNIAHVPETFRRRALEAGIPRETFAQLTTTNPLAWLAWNQVK
jgi:predicted metal-dependent phosphotriesterase family hydrolase